MKHLYQDKEIIYNKQPLEDGLVSIARAQGRVTYPAKSMLIAAQNPCPCGFFGDPTHSCTCAPSAILRYQKKVSGPLLDRIDIHLDVPAVKVEKLTSKDLISNEDSVTVRKRVQKARDAQTKRFAGTNLSSNSDMNSRDIKLFCKLSQECLNLLTQAVEKLHLSARSYHRIIKLARTIADLDLAEEINTFHLAEALQFRPKINLI